MTGDRYHIVDQTAIYFLTFTVVDWLDVFTRKEHRLVVVDSLNFCVDQKGLVVHAWVIMSNHLHLIIRARDGLRISDIIRDFKRHTANTIIRNIQEQPESRGEWLLDRMAAAAEHIKRNDHFKFWRDDNHAMWLESSKFIHRKLAYGHENPVNEQLVAHAEDYLFSSAGDYAGRAGLVKVELLDRSAS